MTMSRAGTPAAEAAWEWWRSVREALPMLRMMVGKTQRQLAAELGTNQGQIGGTERGKYDTVRMPRLMPWLRALGVELVMVDPAGAVAIRIDWPGETGTFVRILRETRRLTQTELATAIGATVQTIYEVELRGAGARITTVAAIFIALGWTPEIRNIQTPELRQAPGETGGNAS